MITIKKYSILLLVVFTFTTNAFYAYSSDNLDVESSFNVAAVDPASFVCPEDHTISEGIYTFPKPAPVDGLVIEQIASPGKFFPYPDTHLFDEVGEYEITFQATNTLGETAICSYTLTVVKSLLRFDCLDDIVKTEGNLTFPEPEAKEGFTVVQKSSFEQGQYFSPGSYTIEHEVSNGIESKICSYILTVSPSVSKMLCPDNYTAVEGVVNFQVPAAVDGLTITQISGPAQGSIIEPGDYEIEFEAANEVGETSTCSYVLTIVPSVDRMVCMDDISFTEGTISFPEPADVQGLTITQIAGPSQGSELAIGEYTITFQAENTLGDIATCSYQLNVVPSPTRVTCLEDEIVMEGVVIFPEPLPFDGLTITQVSGPAQNSELASGNYTIEHKVENAGGDHILCSYILTVVPAPSRMECLEDLTMTEGTVTFPVPAEVDGLTITQISGPTQGSELTLGNYTLTFKAENILGQTAECSYELNILPSPTRVVCLEDQLVLEGVVNFSTPAEVDGLTITQISGPTQNTELEPGNYPLEFKVENATGDNIICSYDLKVVPAASRMECLEDQTMTEGTITFPVPAEVEGLEITQTDGPTNGGILVPGEYTITFQAENALGQTETCSYALKIIPSTNKIACVESEMVREGVVNFPEPASVEGLEITQIEGPAQGSDLAPGDYTITFEAKNDLNESNRCSYILTVVPLVDRVDCIEELVVLTEGEELPVLTGFEGLSIEQISDLDQNLNPGLYTVEHKISNALGDSEFCSYELKVIPSPTRMECVEATQVNQGAVTFPEPAEVDGLTITQISGPAQGSDLAPGDYTIEFEAENEKGQKATCSYVLTVLLTADNIVCLDDVSLIEGTVGFPVLTAVEGLTITQISGPSQEEVLEIGNYSVVFEIKNELGDTETCSYELSIIPSVDRIECIEDVVLTEGETSYPIPGSFEGLTLSQTSGPLQGDVLEVGSYAVEFLIKNSLGDEKYCSYNLKIVPAPSVLECLEDIIVPEGMVEFSPPNAVEGLTIVQKTEYESGVVYLPGIYELVYEATNELGVKSTCSYTITVVPSVARMECLEDIALTAGVVENVPKPSEVNGLIITQTSGPKDGDFLDVGEYPIAFQVTNALNETSTCSYKIVVYESPTKMECLEDIIVLEGELVNFEAPVVEGLDIIQTTNYESGKVYEVGEYEVVYKATNAIDDTHQCSFTITVTPTVSKMECLEDFTISAGEITFPVPAAVEGLTITQTSEFVQGQYFSPGQYVISFQGENKLGEIITCSYTMTVFESVNAVSCFEDMTVTEGKIQLPVPTAVDGLSITELTTFSDSIDAEGYVIVKPGDYDVIFKIVNQLGDVSYCSYKLIVLPNFANVTDVRSYPNPATEGFVNISTAASYGQVRVKLYLPSGILVKDQVFYEKGKLNVRDLKTGIYIIELYSGGHTVKNKLVVKN